MISYEMPRFGAIVGITSALFNLIICFLRRKGVEHGHQFYKNMSAKTCASLAAAISVVPLYFGLQTKELTLLTTLFYPLALRCFSDKLIQERFLPNWGRKGEFLAYILITFRMIQTFMFEDMSSTKAFTNMVNFYCQWNGVESRVYA